MRTLTVLLLSLCLLSISSQAVEFKGKVQYTDGSPVGGAIIYGCRDKNPLRVHNNDSAPETLARVWSAVTDTQGRYRILDVPSGTYEVRAFRRLALNNGSRTLEAVNEITIPSNTEGEIEITHDMTIELDQFLPLEIGAMAPLFNAQSLNGKSIDLEALRGNIVVLHFYAAWCGICVQTIDEYTVLAKKFSDKNVTVIGISLDESIEEAQAFYQERGLNHPVIYQGSFSKNQLRKDYRVVGIPDTFVIAPDGTISQFNIHGDVLDLHVEQLVLAQEK